MRLFCEGAPKLLLSDNESNAGWLWGRGTPGFYKDGINDYVVHGRREAVHPESTGTTAAAHYLLIVTGGGSVRLRLRLRPDGGGRGVDDFDRVVALRRAEADAFYAALQADIADPMPVLCSARHWPAFCGQSSSIIFDIPEWLHGDQLQPTPPAPRQYGRNADWEHLNNADIVSIPDKWEYPWYAAWDPAFHCVALAQIDPDFAKDQLLMMTSEWYMHPKGQLPAYEWAFGDVNPPVHPWAA
jgi:hypothetical protein